MSVGEVLDLEPRRQEVRNQRANTGVEQHRAHVSTVLVATHRGSPAYLGSRGDRGAALGIVYWLPGRARKAGPVGHLVRSGAVTELRRGRTCAKAGPGA
jgi:hypothetical protein